MIDAAEQRDASIAQLRSNPAVKRVEVIGGQTLILGDSRLITVGLPQPHGIVTDPPYGIGADTGVGKYGRTRGFKAGWDSEAPDLGFLPAVPSIIWGGNYFPLPPSRAFLIWDKGAGFKGRDFAECEMAWCSFDANARVLSYDPLARGDYRGGNKQHPTQKPVALMEWCIGFLPKAQTILDPFAGSGSTLVACQKLGRQGTGIEIDPDYWTVACERVHKAWQEPDMFIEQAAPKAQQVELL